MVIHKHIVSSIQLLAQYVHCILECIAVGYLNYNIKNSHSTCVENGAYLYYKCSNGIDMY